MMEVAGSGLPFDFLSLEGCSELDGLLAEIADAAPCGCASVCAFVALVLLTTKAMATPPTMAQRLLIELP